MAVKRAASSGGQYSCSNSYIAKQITIQSVSYPQLLRATFSFFVRLVGGPQARKELITNFQEALALVTHFQNRSLYVENAFDSMRIIWAFLCEVVGELQPFRR